MSTIIFKEFMLFDKKFIVWYNPYIILYKETTMNINDTIICPHCGKEYLPGEIYLPEYFLGQPTNIVRDETSIYSYDGTEQDLTETYTCDNCGYTFDVIAHINYETKLNQKHFFDEDYSTTIYGERVNLDESESE